MTDEQFYEIEAKFTKMKTLQGESEELSFALIDLEKEQSKPIIKIRGYVFNIDTEEAKLILSTIIKHKLKDLESVSDYIKDL